MFDCLKKRVEARVAPAIVVANKYDSIYAKAASQMGQKEIYGKLDNPQIVDYFMATDYGKTHDETPWCAAFINWCLRECGFERTRSAAAVSFLKWGVPLPVSSPVKGCIMVLEHPSGGHHVTLFQKEENSYYYGLGGNQANEVNISKWPKSELMKNGFRGFPA